MKFKATKKRSLVPFYKMLMLNVFAEEPNTQATVTATIPNNSGNAEAIIALARSQERDKLYPEIEKWKSKHSELLSTVKDKDSKIASLEVELAKAKADLEGANEKVKTGSQAGKTVTEQASRIAELELQVSELQAQYEADVNSVKIDSYKQLAIAKAGNEIIPELVTGTTEEEINASIEASKQRYLQITQSAVQNVQMPTANPSATVMSLGEVNLNDISSMNPKQWAEYRAQLGLK